MNELKMHENKLAILVLSCDKNCDLWPPFFSFYQKYWKDCNYNVYLGTNFLKFESDFVTTINSNVKSNWSSELKIILNGIPEKNVLIILEDYFIYQKVNTSQVEDVFNTMLKYNAGFMMLGCFPTKYRSLWNYTILSDTPAYGIIDSRSNYLVNLQIGIWNKAILTNILVEGESPWEFELKASKRFAKNNFLSLCVRENRKLNHVHGPIVYLCGALTKGVIMRDAIRLCKKENIEFNINGKKVETLEEEILRRSYIALPLSIRKVIGYLKASVKRIISK